MLNLNALQRRRTSAFRTAPCDVRSRGLAHRLLLAASHCKLKLLYTTDCTVELKWFKEVQMERIVRQLFVAFEYAFDDVVLHVWRRELQLLDVLERRAERRQVLVFVIVAEFVQYGKRREQLVARERTGQPATRAMISRRTSRNLRSSASQL